MFEDRTDAGHQLARRLEHLKGDDVVVLGLPRGGVPVAREVARALGAPLDVLVVRKLGLPRWPELAMGAIGEEGFEVRDEALIARAGVTAEEIRAVESRERATLVRRMAMFRGARPRVDLNGRTAVIVDDGIATGATAQVACRIARHLGASRVVLAVPVAPPDSVIAAGKVADEVIAVSIPEHFYAVGAHYRHFDQVDDSEVVRLLEESSTVFDGEIAIPTEGIELAGHLRVPAGARGVVVFAHGSGSSRHSPRNQYVADVLERAGIGTLLLDLLTMEEESDRALVFDIPLLARRVVAAVRWVGTQPETRGLEVGLFGASTGAGAALVAASDPALGIAAVVSRGGRPDLAGEALRRVVAPTLLVVGGADPMVLELNRRASQLLRGPRKVVVVPGATHLFEEPGTLRHVAELARDWFAQYLVSSPSRREAS